MDRSDEDEDIVAVPREAWKAEDSKTNLNELNLPVDRYIIAHTVGGNCSNKNDCLKVVKSIQHMHMYDPRFLFDDIAYNFLIGGDGNVYEGCDTENLRKFFLFKFLIIFKDVDGNTLVHIQQATTVFQLALHTWGILQMQFQMISSYVPVSYFFKKDNGKVF